MWRGYEQGVEPATVGAQHLNAYAIYVHDLVRHKGEVVSRQKLLEDVWGYDALPSTRTVDNQVLTLRQKLGGKDKDAHIVTVHGVGYKFVGL